MSELWSIERVLELLQDDRAFLDELEARGLSALRPEGIDISEVERLRVAHVLVRELEVNWEGVEIILRLRQELVATRSQVHELLALLSDRLSR